MKKSSALALAIAGIVAAPVASAEVYVSARLGFEYIDSDASSPDDTSILEFGNLSSRLGWRGETDLGLAILEGSAEAGFAIEAAARTLKLEFIPLVRERYDLLIGRRDYFEPPVQTLLAFARGEALRARAEAMGGYDIAGLGRVHLNGP